MTDTIRVLIPVGFALPIFAALDGTYWGSMEWVSAYDSTTLYRAWNSFCLAGLTIIGSLCLGMAVTLATLRLPRMGQWLVIGASLIPLSFPPFGTAIAWVTACTVLSGEGGRILLGQSGGLQAWLHTLPGCAAVLSLSYWPIPFLLLLTMGVPGRSAHEAAVLQLTHWQRIRWVWFPTMRYPLLLSALVVGTLALLQFEVPSLLQIDVYPVEIFTQFSALMNEQQAFALCLPYVALLPVLALGFRGALPGGRSRLQTVPQLPFTAFAGGGLLLLTVLILLLSLAFPLAALASHMEWKTFGTTLSQHKETILRSVWVAMLGAVLPLVLGLFLAATSSRRTHSIIVVITLFMLVLPSALIASAWLQARSMVPLYGGPFLSWTFLFLSVTGHKLAFGYLAGCLVWQCYGNRAREADRIIGTTLWQRFTIIWPASMLSPVVASLGLLFLLLWGELAIPILMHPPGGETLVMMYFSLLHYGSESRTTGIGFLVLVIPFLGAMMGLGAWSAVRTLQNRKPA